MSLAALDLTHPAMVQVPPRAGLTETRTLEQEIPQLRTDLLAAGLAGYYNVKSSAYGAKGDGSTDDAAAIQAAVNACKAAGGGTVYFPPGKYIVGSRIDIATWVAGKVETDVPVWFRGAARAASVLVRKAGFTGALVRFGGVGANDDYQNGGGVLDLGFRVPDAQVPGLDYNAAALQIWNCRAFTAQNLLFREGACDLDIRGTASSEFNNLESFREIACSGGAGSHAIIIEQGENVCGDLFFTNCNIRVADPYQKVFEPVTDTTVLIKACDGVFFTGGHLQGGKNVVRIDMRDLGGGVPAVVTGIRFTNVWMDLTEGQLETVGCENTVLIEGNAVSYAGVYSFVGCVFMSSATYKRGLFIAPGTKVHELQVLGCHFSGYRMHAINIQPGLGSDGLPQVSAVKIDNNTCTMNWLSQDDASTIRAVINVNNVLCPTVTNNTIIELNELFKGQAVSNISRANVAIGFGGVIPASAPGACHGNTIKLNVNDNNPAANNTYWQGQKANAIVRDFGGTAFVDVHSNPGIPLNQYAPITSPPEAVKTIDQVAASNGVPIGGMYSDTAGGVRVRVV